MDADRLLDGRLKLRHLVLVTTIAEQGSIVGAAERMHVAQPVVTRGLRELEMVLGVQLFERGPRGVKPTIYGEAFVDHARAVLAEIRQAGRHVSELSGGTRGRVVVGNHLAGANVLLPKAISRLKRLHPYISVVVREATPDRLLEDLLTGDVDLIVGRLPGGESDRVTQIRLYDEPVRVVVRSGHPATCLPEPALDDLLGYPWVLPVAQTALREELEQVFIQQGLSLPANQVECTSILILRGLLTDSDTVATLPMLIAREDTALTMLSTNLPNVRRLVGVTLPKDRVCSPSATSLLNEIQDVGAEIRQSLETGEAV
jgi:DNA-binding transcriptional LysR family regulator